MKEVVLHRWSFLVGFIAPLAIFWATAIFFAFKIRAEMPPDEVEHVLRTLILTSDKAFFFQEGSDIYLGPLHCISYLSYSIQAVVLAILDPNESSVLLVLRLVNLVIYSGTLAAIGFLAYELFGSPIVAFAAPVLINTIPMFSFLASSVTYDNLANLACAAFYLFAIRALRRSALTDLFIGLLFLGVACLAKFSVLPLIIPGLILIGIFVCSRPFPTPMVDKWFVCALISCLSVWALNGSLYGANVIRYGSLTPSCAQVFGQERCQAENYESQRGATIRQAAQEAAQAELPFVDYCMEYIRASVERTFGLMAHKSLLRSRVGAVVCLSVFLVGYALSICLLKSTVLAREYRWMHYTIVYYLTVVMCKNYIDYSATGYVFGMALQGRYNFPVFPLIIVLSTFGLSRLLGRFAFQYGLPLLCFVMTLAGGNLWIYREADRDWYVTNSIATLTRELPK